MIRRTKRTAVIAAAMIAVGALAVGVLVVTNGESAKSGRPSGVAEQPSPSFTTDAVIGPDSAVSVLGWVPEPITGDPAVYSRAALEAAGTFDTRLATRSEWVEWLGTWFTPSPLYDDRRDAVDQMAGYLVELDQAVVLPQSRWDDLARENGRVSAHVAGQVVYLDLPETTQRRVWTATADVVMTYTHAADSGEVSYDETVRVSVQVTCGGAQPTSGSEQQPGNCKVVRFFGTAVG